MHWWFRLYFSLKVEHMRLKCSVCCGLCRRQLQRSGRLKTARTWSLTLRTLCVLASCAIFTTALTWSTWHKMRGLMHCSHWNTPSRSTFLYVLLFSASEQTLHEVSFVNLINTFPLFSCFRYNFLSTCFVAHCYRNMTVNWRRRSLSWLIERLISWYEVWKIQTSTACGGGSPSYSCSTLRLRRSIPRLQGTWRWVPLCVNNISLRNGMETVASESMKS